MAGWQDAPLASAPAMQIEVMPATDMRGRMVKAWIDKAGVPQHVAEGIADRAIGVESGGNPTAIGDHGTSGGLYQEHDTRFAGLKAWAERQGKSWKDPDLQNDYAIWEATKGDSIAAQHWDEIKAAPDRKTAKDLFTKYFERPASSGWAGAPVTGGGKYKSSDADIAYEQGRSNTDVVWLSPDDYINGVAPSESGRKRRPLSERLAIGDETPIPSLEASVKDGRLKITDYDGLERAKLAKQEGVDLIPVAIHGVGKETPAWVEDMRGQVRPFNFTQVPRAKLPAPSRLERFGTGAADLVAGALQLGAHVPVAPEFSGMLPEEAQKALDPVTLGRAADEVVQDREKRIEQERAQRGETGTDWWRVAGNAAATVPLGFAGPAGMGMRGMMLGGAMGGAAGAGLMPVTEGEFGPNKIREILLGAGAGAATTAMGGAAMRAAAPYIAPAAQRLLDRGVDLLPGQLKGGWRQALEEASRSVPFSGAAVGNAQRRAVEKFNRAGYDQALSPLGEKFAGDKVGWDGIDQLETQLGAHYDALLPKIRMKIDPTFARDYLSLTELTKELPEDAARQFDQIMKNRLWTYLGPEQAADGRTFKTIESELGGRAREMLRSDNETQRSVGKAVQTVLGMLRENLERENPAERAALQKINTAWAGFARLREAAANRVKSLGVFTPGDLLTAEKRMSGKRIFARGDGMMQDFAKDAEEVIGSKVPDSGTAVRYGTMAEMAAMGGELFANPALFAAHVGAHLGHAAAYSSPGLAVLRGVSGAGFPRARNAMSRLLERLSLGASPAVGAGVVPQ